MAGRIRSIKPELNDDEVVGMISGDGFKLWIGTWLIADDHGNLRDGGRYLEGAVFTHRPPERPIAELRQELIDAGLLTPYQVRGQRYLSIKGWKKHQRVDKPGAPRVPGPDEVDESGNTSDSFGSRDAAGDSRGSPEALAKSQESHAPRARRGPDPDPDPGRDLGPGPGGGSGEDPAEPGRPTHDAIVLAYADGVFKGTANPYVPPSALPEHHVLEQIWEVHGRTTGRSPAEFLTWIRDQAKAYALAHPGQRERRFQGGYKPSKFAEWLNAGGASPAVRDEEPGLESDPEDDGPPPYVRGSGGAEKSDLGESITSGIGNGGRGTTPQPRPSARTQ